MSRTAHCSTDCPVAKKKFIASGIERRSMKAGKRKRGNQPATYHPDVLRVTTTRRLYLKDGAGLGFGDCGHHDRPTLEVDGESTIYDV
eukprot:COSAG02_NODE_244_length_27402_cov_41.050397_22_plen_88_part_00